MLSRRYTVSLVIILTIAAYASTWRAGFVYEDVRTVTMNGVVQGNDPWQASQLRAVSWLSLRANYLLDGLNPRGYHAANVLIHLVNGGLVYQIAMTLGGPTVAIWAFGIFLLHPLQSEAVAYVSGRTELLSAFGILLAFWGATREVARDRWPITVVILGVIIALGSKEMGAVVFPLLAWYLWIWYPDRVWAHRRALGWVAWVALLSVGFLGRQISRGDLGLLGSERGLLSYVAIQCVAMWHYLWMVIVPMGFSIDHDYDLINHLWAYSLLVFTIICAVSIYALRHRRPSMVFALGWVLIALLPRLIIRIPEYVNEHQMYVPMIGMSLAIGFVARALHAYHQTAWLLEPPGLYDAHEV